MNPPQWHTLFWNSATPRASFPLDALRESIAGAGYTAYDPFGLLPGRSYPYTVRLFIAPPSVSGWVRVLSNGELPASVYPALSADAVLLAIAIHEESPTFTVYANTDPADPVAALASYLVAPHTPDDLRRALTEPLFTVLAPADAPNAVLPLDALPPDVQRMAQSLDPHALQQMFQKVSGGLVGKAGGDADAARALVEASKGINWDAGDLRRVVNVLRVLGVGDWRTPDFRTLSDAYALHRRRQRKPDARLYPGDSETLAAVPNALDYTPLYAGKEG